MLHNRILKDSSFEQNRDKIDDMLSSDTEERIVVVSSSHPSSAQAFNPYHLSSVNNGYEENNRISRQFDTSATNIAKNTDYYFYLRRIYSFWYEYLPSLYKNYQDRTGRSSSEQDKLLENGEMLEIIQSTSIDFQKYFSHPQVQARILLDANACLPSARHSRCLRLHPKAKQQKHFISHFDLMTKIHVPFEAAD